MVNVPLTISTLTKYYSDFRNEIGADFKPQEMVDKLRVGESKEWEQLLHNPKTLGILAGYGYKNAQLFTEQLKKANPLNRPSENNDPRLKADCYLNDVPFRIPIFAMLDEAESAALVAEYKKEREQIVKEYKGKNFLNVTLRQLKGK